MFKQMMIAVMMLMVVSGAGATEYYVAATNGEDTNSGQVDAPFNTIMHAVNKAKAGDTIYLDNGTYREEIVLTGKGEKNAPVTICAKSGATPIIKGSDIVTGWKKYKDNIWERDNWQSNSQQVFVDGKILKQIGFYSKAYPAAAADGNWMLRAVGKDVSDMQVGSFYYDREKHILYVWLQNGENPNQHLMEASVRKHLIKNNGARHIFIKGITFRHSNTSAFKQGGAGIELPSDSTIIDCDIQWCDFAGVSAAYKGENSSIINCVISNNGDSGVAASLHKHFIIRGCTIMGNNYRHFNQTWHAGGIKVIPHSWGIIENCNIGNNFASGIWFDSCYKDVGNSIIKNNYIYNNARQGGIMIELSDHVSIINNVLYNNDQFGIHYVVSSYGEITGNMIIGQRDFIALDISGPRNNSDAQLSHNVIMHNSVIDSKCKYDLHIIQPDGKYVMDNKCDYNFFVRAGGPKLRYSAGGRKNWRNIIVTGNIAKWRSKTGFDEHSIVINKDTTADIHLRTK